VDKLPLTEQRLPQPDDLVLAFADRPPAKRTTSRASVASAAARTLVAPFVAPMGEWQMTLARTEAALRSSHTRASEKTSLIQALEALSRDVRDHAAALDRAATSTGPALACHGRVVDVRNALAALIARIDAALGERRN